MTEAEQAAARYHDVFIYALTDPRTKEVRYIGHPFDAHNTYTYWRNGKVSRACMQCARDRKRARREQL